MKFTKVALLLSMLVLGVACSEPEEYNPTIDKPSTDNGDNDYNTDKEKVSIVGSWQRTMLGNGYTYKDTLTFNQDGTGVYSLYRPTWDENDNLVYRTYLQPFTYEYRLELGLLKIKNMNFSDEVMISFDCSVFIVSHNNEYVLHVSYCIVEDIDLSFSGAYTKVQ